MLPLNNRIPHIVLSSKIPITLVYGSNDWVDVEAGESMLKSVQTALIKDGANPEMMNFHVISDTGHHVFLECSDTFNDIVKFELQLVDMNI